MGRRGSVRELRGIEGLRGRGVVLLRCEGIMVSA